MNRLFAVLAGGRVVFLVHRFLWPGAVGIIRRRRLIARRRLGQGFPRRFTLERCRLGFIAAEQTAETAAITELGRAQDRVFAGVAAGLIARIAGGVRRFRSALVELARRQDAAGLDWILVVFLARRDRSLAPRFVGILWPVRWLHLIRGDRRRRRKMAGRLRAAPLAVAYLSPHLGGKPAAVSGAWEREPAEIA